MAVSVTGLTAARMAAIEDSIVTDGYVSGDDLILQRHDGSTVNAGNVRGASGATGRPSIVTSLPGSPSNGDEVYFQTSAMAALNIMWHMKYNTAAGKWIFLGGAEMYDRRTINQTSAASATMYELSTGSPTTLTAPAAGVYEITYGGTGQENIGAAVRADVHMNVYKNGTGVGVLEEAWACANGGYDKWMIENKIRLTLAANDVIRPRGMITSASWANFYWKTAYIRMVPVTLG